MWVRVEQWKPPAGFPASLLAHVWPKIPAGFSLFFLTYIYTFIHSYPKKPLSFEQKQPLSFVSKNTHKSAFFPHITPFFIHYCKINNLPPAHRRAHRSAYFACNRQCKVLLLKEKKRKNQLQPSVAYATRYQRRSKPWLIGNPYTTTTLSLAC